jgi:lipoprotein
MHKIELPLVALCFCTLLAGCSSNQPAPLNDDSTTEAITTTTTNDLQQQIDDLQSQVSELQSQLATTTTTYPTAYEIGGEIFSADEWIKTSDFSAKYGIYAHFDGVELLEIGETPYFCNRSQLSECHKSGIPKPIEAHNANDVCIHIITMSLDNTLLNISDLRAAGIIE